MSEQAYPALRAALHDYIAKDREDELVLKYRKYGEDSLEFKGLSGELEKIAEDPASAVPLFRNEFGTDPEPSEIREGCIELYDKLHAAGKYDPDNEPVPEGAELFDQYGKRPVMIGEKPLLIRGQEVPLWLAFAVSLLIVAAGWGIGQIHVPVLPVIALIIMVVGLVLAFVTSAALWGYRNDARDPGREERREKALQEAREKREAKAAERGNWLRRNFTP